ncbi:hypothetical protein C8U37_105136 [Trichococcus patagoniensis]|uniref:Uncharacterized protein n=1 Tax=Trichococcus patagoniensis TaxID=382641 RepID=A0A2T5IN42_9LACT|nr:hypothetical protein C8U37_105136 [Trichococcus patagoniensis]
MEQLLFFDSRVPLVGFLRIIRQPQDLMRAVCRILPPYPTTSGSHAGCLSDSSALSDNLRISCGLFVGFLRIIRQPQDLMRAVCRIPPPYPTTSGSHAGCLSDSSALSDNLRISCGLFVGFLRLIRQPQDLMRAVCRIPPPYPTTSGSHAGCLSDSSALSDNYLHSAECDTQKKAAPE